MSWLSSWFSKTPSSTSSNLPSEKLEPSQSAPAEPSLIQEPPQIIQAPQVGRSNQSKVVFAAGTVFFAFSLLITRRAFARRRLAANPAFYTNAPAHNAQQATKVSGAIEAFEALNIATVNLLSLSMMATGGALWYLDINSMSDARRVLRGGLGVDGSGRDEKEVEEEFEEWMATVLSRKEAKGTKVQLKNERGKER
jgi:hypothetical protein